MELGLVTLETTQMTKVLNVVEKLTTLNVADGVVVNIKKMGPIVETPTTIFQGAGPTNEVVGETVGAIMNGLERTKVPPSFFEVPTLLVCTRTTAVLGVVVATIAGTIVVLLQQLAGLAMTLVAGVLTNEAVNFANAEPQESSRR